MQGDSWEPATKIEQAMLAALSDGDSNRFVQLLKSATLYLPRWIPSSGIIAEILPGVAEDQTVVFTSAETLFWSLGAAASGYDTYDLRLLVEQLSDQEAEMVINPGTPVGVLLSLSELDEVASGHQSLDSRQAVRDSVMDETLASVRAVCLDDLGGSQEAAEAASADSTYLTELESNLRSAVSDLDFDSFLATLVTSDVVVPTQHLPESEQLHDSHIRWRITGDAEIQIVPVFSSARMLKQIASQDIPHTRAHFTEVLRNWPGQDYVLCFNPGTGTELILPGASLTELLAALDSANGQ